MAAFAAPQAAAVVTDTAQPQRIRRRHGRAAAIGAAASGGVERRSSVAAAVAAACQMLRRRRILSLLLAPSLLLGLAATTRVATPWHVSEGFELGERAAALNRIAVSLVQMRFTTDVVTLIPDVSVKEADAAKEATATDQQTKKTGDRIATATKTTTTTPSLEETLQNAAEEEKEFKKSLAREQADAEENRHPHPFWVLDWREVAKRLPRIMICATTLWFSGFLCAAAGVGGNIIQVSVLMAVGELSPHDAVPISKVVVLAGSIGALCVHLRWSGGKSRNLVSWELCRLAVPACLLGTVIGVALNRRMPDMYIVFLLSLLLFCISLWVFIQAAIMYNNELDGGARDRRQSRDSADGLAAELGMTPRGSQWTPPIFAVLNPPDATECIFKEENPPTKTDMGLILALLLLVVMGGIMAELTEKCHDAVYMGWEEDSPVKCQHPFLRIVFWGSVKGLALNRHAHNTLQLVCIFLPVLGCVAYGEYAAHRTLASATAMSRLRVRVVQVFLFIMGLIGSLTGIGGGVALSPFFIMLGLTPQKTVATSITCVMFISASSALQYMITNRVKMALACIYAVVNVLASCLGAVVVHLAVERWAKPSIIMAVIGCSVLVSFGLSVHRAAMMAKGMPIASF